MNPNAIALGINPHQITNAQVGTGYRLTTRVPAEPENVALRDAERAALKPEILTTSGGWAPASYETLDFLRRALFSHTSTATTPDGQRIMLPPTFRVPITPTFIAWAAKQRPERATAKQRRDQRISDAEDEILEAKEEYDLARKAAFFDTAAEYGYVPPGDNFLRMVPGDIRFTTDGTDPTETHGSLYWQVVEKPVAQFPPLPAGVKWVNQDGMTPEQFEVEDGWRPLCTLDTKWPDDNEFFSSCNGWVKGEPGDIISPTLFSMGSSLTYRTRAPIPQPKPEFPPLPAGASWYNPAGLTPEEYGVADGWRPYCTLDKTFGTGQGRYYNGVWYSFYNSSNTPHWYFEEEPKISSPQRTKAPIPTA